MAIPRIIHQTFKSADIPGKFSRYREHLISLHPGWEYKFYDDEACREAVEKFFPAFLPIYDHASVIQRTDIFRVIVVYGEGGFYLDMDIECLNPLDDLCEFRCVLGEELTLAEEDAERLGHRDRRRVANYMFGSEPGHPFLLRILRKIAGESRRDILTENDVLESTGSGLVTTVYHDWKDKLRDVVLLLNRDRMCPVIGAVSCHFGNYGRHHHEGSWRFEHLGTRPFKENVSKADVKKLLTAIDEEIAALHIPDDIYIFRTFHEEPFDGLTTVYVRATAIGTVINDAKKLRNKKVLVCGMPAHFSDKLSGQNMTVIYTTFESTELPGFWIKALNGNYDHCIVPHDYMKEVFIASGVRIPIEVVHQGFTRHKRTWEGHLQRDVFRIGFLGVPYKRKNLFKLYQACINLLGKIPGLRLAVHTAKLFRGMRTPELRLVEHSPFVEWTDGTLSEDDTAKWYAGLSCYVFPSSGEGWSFTPRESLYMGVPTILSDIPVHRELIESGYCRAIPVSGKEDSDFEGNKYGQWDRVSVNDIEEAIWDVYRNYGSYLIRALQGGRWIENKWTNESSQQMLLEFMRSL
jgi:glycosyltransferase involved in cell wall biosynthesis